MDGPRAPVIAIVDDDASLRRSLKNLLTSVGFQVEAFGSAEAFLASPPPENTACMVLDLRMDGMSGLELLRYLGATGSRVPVIVLTAHGDDAARQQSLEAGAVGFFEKPFHAATLVEAIRRSLDRNGQHPSPGLGGGIGDGARCTVESQNDQPKVPEPSSSRAPGTTRPS